MTKGVKHDDGKLDYTLLPYEALQEVVKVLMYGAQKYPEADNWKRVEDPRKRYNKAAFRHLFAEVNNEALDKESGLYHLAHAICSNLFALHFAIKDLEVKEIKNQIENDFIECIRCGTLFNRYSFHECIQPEPDKPRYDPSDLD